MIAKTFLTGKGFGETCSYLCQEQSKGEVLAARGVRAHDPELMAADFEWQHGLMPDKEKPVYHCVLSFAPGERVGDELLVKLGKGYLEKIGMVNTQYVFVKHTDKEHLHVHVLANRVDDDGMPTGKGLIIERGIRAAQELTEAFGLRKEEGKRLEHTNREALHEPDAKRYRIYETIREVLPCCRSLDDLEKGLMEAGIAMRYRYEGECDERTGISFRLENRSFKGSRVDKEYSLKGLEHTLLLQEELRQKPELFCGMDWDERLRLMRDKGLRSAEEQRVEELKRQKESAALALKQANELQQELGLRRGMRHHL